MSKTHRFGRSVRSVALVAAGTLAFGVLPATSAQADAHGTPFDLQAACENAPDSQLDSAGDARLQVVEDCLSNWDGPDGDAVLGGTGGNANFGLDISRAQYAIVLVRIAAINGLDIPAAPATPTFPDVPTTHPFYDEIEAAAALGLFEGQNDGTFNPNGPISFAQVVATVARLYRDALEGDTTDDGNGTDSGLSCGFAQADLELLESRSFFAAGTSTLPDTCGESATRGQVFDAFATLLTYQVSTGAIDAPFAPPTNATLGELGPDMILMNKDDDNPKARSYTFTGLDDDTKYDIALFPVTFNYNEDSVRWDAASGTWIFRDQNAGFDSIADGDCQSSTGYANIVSVNGDPVGDCDEYDVKPEDGEFEIRVDNSDDNGSHGETDSFFIVIWESVSDSNDDLDLNADDTPSVEFGIAGPLVFDGGECKTGTDFEDELVIFVDGNKLHLEDEDCWVSYDKGSDDFFYNEDFSISGNEFEAWVHAGDQVTNEDDDSAFDYTRTGKNTFSLHTDYANTPMDVEVTVGDFDESSTDTANNDVMVTWTHDPAFGNMSATDDENTEYCFNLWEWNAVTEQYDYEAGLGCVDWEDEPDAMEDLEWTIEDISAGDWVITVDATTAEDSDSDYSDPSEEFTADVASGAPKSTGTTTNDVNLNGKLDTGDVLTVTFDEDMNVDVTGDTITVKDTDGTQCTLTHGGNATFAYSDVTAVPGEETLTITLTSAAVCTAAGSIGGMAFPAEVVASDNIVDQVQGLDWDLTGSADVTFD